MNLMQVLTAAQTTGAQTAAKIEFNPSNFVTNLKYMGIGMLVIFMIIGVIILTTLMIKKVFTD